MGSLQNILGFMEGKNKLPLAIFFVFLPTLLYIAISMACSLPLGVSDIIFNFASDIISLATLSVILYVLVLLLKDKGRYGLTDIFNKLSLIYVANFILGLLAIIAIMVLAPTFFSTISSLGSQELSASQIKAVIESIPIASDTVLFFSVLAFVIIGLVVFAFSVYVIYRTIADYSKATFARNLIILLILLLIMIVINYLSSVIAA